MTDYSARLRLLFDKYQRRQCTADEVQELLALLEQPEANDALTQPMKDLWQSFKEDKKGYNVDWNKMYANISSTGNSVAPGLQNKASFKRMWLAAAAVFILIAGAGGYVFLKNNHHSNNNTIAVKPAQFKKHNNTQTIYLPDSSTVILNKGSKLDYQAFNSHTREVYLTGEGFFDIKHNAAKPFLVHTGKLTIKVLGTAFNIKAYPGDDAIEVTVTRGKVQVTDGKKSMGLLTANQQLAFSKSTNAVHHQIVDVTAVISWKPVEIVFDDITMEEAVDRIEKRFNMTVDFKNPAIKNCRVSATFSDDDMADEMVGVICSVTRANYTITNNKITIYGKGCN